MPRAKIQGKTDETKRRIVLAAIELVVNEGFAALTMSNVAAKLGVTKPAIYWYFDSKEALIIGINEMVRQEYLSYVNAIAQNSALGAMEKLARVVSLAEEKGGNELSLCIVTMKLLLENLTRDDEITALLRSSYLEYAKGVEQILREGMEEGVFRKDISPFNTALFLVGALDGALQQTVLHFGKGRIATNFSEGNGFLLLMFRQLLCDENKTS